MTAMLYKPSEICVCGHSALVHVIRCCVSGCKCLSFTPKTSKS